jgi:signal transduction histidine kinase
LNQVLDLSKIEAGRMELFVEEVDVGATVASVAASYRAAVEAGGNAFEVAVPDDLGTIRTDRSKLQQALGHLLDNAAKFTEDGGIAVMAERRAGPAGEEIIVAVRDTGIGIEPARLPELFEQFTVVDDSSASKYGGTGLGLALSRKLCRLMGGDVTAESELGLGSCFTLRLPVGPARTATQTAAGEQMAPAGLPRAA